MRHRTASLALAVGAAAAAATACHSAARALSPTGELALGTWGGANAGVIVTDTLTHVHIGCTFGDIPGRVKLDANGRFTLDGTYVLRAYPVYVGPTLPAQFSGVLDGKALTISVAVHDTTTGKVVSLGPATVEFGKDPQLGPCPICSVPGARMRGAPPPAVAGRALLPMEPPYGVLRVWMTITPHAEFRLLYSRGSEAAPL
jgi:hypothetical protein